MYIVINNNTMRYYYCRTLEKALEIFEKIFWKWVERNQAEFSPNDFVPFSECSTWEEVYSKSLEKRSFLDLVDIIDLVFEEDIENKAEIEKVR